MRDYALDLWRRADKALETAGHNAQQEDFDAAASRAYYAAFYAISALFAWQGRTFRKHSRVEAAVHGDLVKSGGWPADLGSDYRALRRLRDMADYGGLEHVTSEQAAQAIQAGRRIAEAVGRTCPELAKGAG